MAWLILLASAVLEAVWASALGRSDGFTQPVPTVVFLVAVTLSMIGLARAMRSIPIGTAYAVWTGIGAALTVTYAIATGAETVSVAKVVFLVGIVGAVVGLKLVPAAGAGDAGARDEGAGDEGARDESAGDRAGDAAAEHGASERAEP